MNNADTPTHKHAGEAHDHDHHHHDHHHHDHHDHDHHDHDHHGHDHHGHDHHHGGLVHSHAPSSLKALGIVLAMTGTIFFAELIAGLISGSLALLSDAMHMLSDATGLILSFVAIVIGRRAADKRSTYGYRRVEVLAALINALTVSLVCVWIVWEAIQRFRNPDDIDTRLMLTVGMIGLIANAVSAWILVRRQHDSLNMKGAYLHVLSDLLGSFAVIVAGLIINWTGWLIADTIASLIIAALVLPRSIRLLMDTLDVLLERAPRRVDMEGLEEKLTELPDIQAVHDLHVWTTDGTRLLATCHLVVADEGCAPGEHCKILDAADAVFAAHGIDHSTIQLETPHHIEHETVC